jgi:hypothetical protein
MTTKTITGIEILRSQYEAQRAAPTSCDHSP